MRRLRTGSVVVVAMLAGACSDDAGDDGAGGSGDSNGSGATATATATASGTTSGGGSSDDATEATTDDSSPGSTSADTALPTGDTTDGSTGSSSDSDGTTTSGSGSTGDGTSTGGESSGESSSGGAIVNDDPFDPASCGGTPITLEDATALLAGMDRQVLANATIQVRERTCPGGACGAWGEAYDWVVTYLTWSGGVTTAYKDFQADMQLVVFDDQGTTRLSLQHVTFDVPSSTYDDEDGMLYDIPPSPISYPHVRAYDEDPDSEYYYQELDWQVRDGVLTVGEDCVRWVADPYVQQPPFTEQYAVVFHW